MDNEIMKEQERIMNSFSDVPPPRFRMGDMVIRQPSEQEIYLKQIELWEQTPCLLGYESVDEYIFRKQYEEANDLDDIRLGEYEIHIWQNEKSIPKMEGKSRWGRGVKKGTPGESKDRLLQSIQKFAAPSAIMGKADRGKMLP